MRNHQNTVSRRTFLQGAGAIGAGTLLLSRKAGARQATATLPQRVLGKTKQKVSTLALGTWPCGRSSEVDVDGVIKLVHESLNLGINFIDAANAYGKAEEALGLALKDRRDQVFLTSKVWADTAEDAEKSLEDSLKKLQTDHLDLVYVHSIGDRDFKKVMAEDGSLDYLVRQKDKGVIRFVGISGHCYPEKFVPLIKTGKVDVIMVAMNFVDLHTYGFEKKVLPVAQEYGLGIACMKVFGGMKGGFEVADGPNTGPMVQTKMLEMAIRYSLGLPDVATLVIGPHTIEQLRENVRMVGQYKPLTAEERESLLAVGKQLAPAWGPHFGPVV